MLRCLVTRRFCVVKWVNWLWLLIWGRLAAWLAAFECVPVVGTNLCKLLLLLLGASNVLTGLRLEVCCWVKAEVHERVMALRLALVEWNKRSNMIALTWSILGEGALHFVDTLASVQEALGLVLRVLIHFLEILIVSDAKACIMGSRLESVVDLRGDLDQEIVVVWKNGLRPRHLESVSRHETRLERLSILFLERAQGTKGWTTDTNGHLLKIVLLIEHRVEVVTSIPFKRLMSKLLI